MPLLTRPPSWITIPYSGLAFDLDFENGRYWQKMPIYDPALIASCSRASTGYADDTSGNWTNFAGNVLRRTNKGFLIEESRTNSLRNNSMQGTVAGTPGTVPTNWTIIAPGGPSTSVVGFGTDSSGIEYIDLRWFGTSSGSASGAQILRFENATQIVASNGQIWTGSAFYSLVGGSFTNITAFSQVVAANNGSGTELTNSLFNLLSSVTNAPLPSQRLANSLTNSNASTAAELLKLRISFNTGVAIDFTLRIGWPQLELGGSATSPIRTTSAAVTRAADVPTVRALPSFGSSYSLYANGTPTAPTTFGTSQIIFQADDGTANERVRLRRLNSTGVAQGVSTTGGSNTALGSSVWVQSTSGKLAIAEANGDQAISFNGGTVATDSASLPLPPTSIRIGCDSAGASQFNGYIKRLVLWSGVRLSNADLQRITT